MNEISVGRDKAGLPHVGGNLAAMVGRVHENVGQDIADQTVVRLSLAVRIRNGASKDFAVSGQKISPTLC